MCFFKTEGNQKPFKGYRLFLRGLLDPTRCFVDSSWVHSLSSWALLCSHLHYHWSVLAIGDTVHWPSQLPSALHCTKHKDENLPVNTATAMHCNLRPPSVAPVIQMLNGAVSAVRTAIGIARGCTPRQRKKFGGQNLQGKVVSAPPGRECTPEAEQESNFWGKWEI